MVAAPFLSVLSLAKLLLISVLAPYLEPRLKPDLLFNY